MPTTSSKPVLQLVVDHDEEEYSNWEIGSLQLDQGEVIRFGEDSEYASAEPGIHSLSCLVVHQAYLRKIGQSYMKLPPERHQHLKTLWEAAKGATPAWQLKLFGDDPYPHFIESKGGRKRFDIWFTDEIELRVESTFQSKKKLPREALLNLRNFLTTPPKIVEPKFVFEILRGRSPISSEYLEGALIFGDEIQIRAKANFTGQIALFWVSSKQSVHELFPSLEIEIDKDASPADFHETKKDFQLTVPEDSTVRVDSLCGVESCIALVRNKKFTPSNSAKLKDQILKTISARSKTTQLFKPDFKEIPLSSTETKSPMLDNKTSEYRLGPSLKFTDWESHLEKALAEFTDRLYVFHIPNQ